MQRAILEACLPCLIALAVAFVLLRVAIVMSGARCDWGRLQKLHRCEGGGVQSLAFVLTLPIFIAIVMFIVQVSQLMVGLMAVNYAAYAAARSASVWIPAAIISEEPDNQSNVLPPPITDEDPILLTGKGGRLLRDRDAPQMWVYVDDDPVSYKYQKILGAAVMACAGVAPSRPLVTDEGVLASPAIESTKRIYRELVPRSQANRRIPDRIRNKIAYSFENTFVRLSFEDKNTERGPRTYNPRRPVELPDGTVVLIWNRQEVGWQDPVTVKVTHNFALLPGPGRLLARYLVRADGKPDRVAPRIEESQGDYHEDLYTTAIWASATFTNEGFKSVVRYPEDISRKFFSHGQ